MSSKSIMIFPINIIQNCRLHILYNISYIYIYIIYIYIIYIYIIYIYIIYIYIIYIYHIYISYIYIYHIYISYIYISYIYIYHIYIYHIYHIYISYIYISYIYIYISYIYIYIISILGPNVWLKDPLKHIETRHYPSQDFMPPDLKLDCCSSLHSTCCSGTLKLWLTGRAHSMVGDNNPHISWHFW